MKQYTLTLLGKNISRASKLFGKGNGSTWPGHIALGAQKTFIKDLLNGSPTKVILVVGTNGKTTTTKIIATILEENDFHVFENTSGANLLNGIASSLLLHTNAKGKLTADFAIFEVDENNLSLVLEEITPVAVVALNLFRDQLDRYGELDSIAKKWQRSFANLPSSTNLILNADDPLVAYLGNNTHAAITYFGIQNGKNEPLSHAADTLYCPKCNHKLTFSTITYSHLGVWSCSYCHLKRPKVAISSSFFPLSGVYNQYNTLAAVGLAKTLGLDQAQIEEGLHAVTPAFGRQETLQYKGKQVQVFLSKNPTGFNESLRTITSLGAKHVLILLNDRIPDGRDVSWIWDMDIEKYLPHFDSITVSGDRAYDMALRIDYAKKDTPCVIEQNPMKALDSASESLPDNETLFVLPTYSAMLDIRKIITGKKIL